MAPQNGNLKALSDAGVSIWLDDLNRSLITDGGLQQLIDEKFVVGVTTNPTIFATALSEGSAYNAQVKDLAEASKDVPLPRCPRSQAISDPETKSLPPALT